MTEGVSIVDPRNTYIDGRARIGRDTVDLPVLRSSRAVSGSATDCRVGPFAHLRDGTVLDDGVEVGAFVEVKRSHLETGAMARHLAYLGDAHVGRDVNIGAAVGHGQLRRPTKSATTIGAGSRIGSGAVLVAPVTLGDARPSSAPARSSPAASTSPTARPSSASPPAPSKPRFRRTAGTSRNEPEYKHCGR